MLMNIQAFMAHKVSCIKKKASAPSMCNSEGKLKDMMKFAAIHNPNIFRLSTLFSPTTFHSHRLCRRQQLKIMVPIDTAHHTIRVSHDSCGNALFNANSMTECPLPRCSKSIILLIAETMKNTHAQLNMVETSIERAKFVVLALFVELVFFEVLAFLAMLMNIQAFMAHKVSCIKKKASAPSMCNSEGKLKDMMKFAAIHNPNIFRLSTLFSPTTFHSHRLCRRQQLKIMVPIDTAHHTIRVSHDSCGNALFNANSMTECPLPRCSKSIILLIAETMKNTHAQLNMAEPSIERAKFVVLALFVEFDFF